MAKDPGGLVHIRCKAVVCCTGGFVHNPDMMRRYAPQFFGAEGEEPTHCFAAPTNTGDVVRLGESAGAYLDRENFFANVFGPVHHPFHFTLFHFANQGEVMTVNLHGERFMDESRMGAGAAAMAHQPGRVAWSILDADTKAYLCKVAETGRDAKDLVGYQEDFEVEEQLDTPLKKADTLEELAQLCGIDGENLKKTVEHYNALCQAGEDVDFGKRPETMRPVVKAPFYAIYGKMATDGAFGGMLVNGRMEVYRADHSGVIGGLYACGDNASGWCLRSKEEGDHRLMASNECNWAISSGFVAGGQAAEWVK
jgi:succinate dehydrogenase/fumarate reductase flavoprotein subunit